MALAVGSMRPDPPAADPLWAEGPIPLPGWFGRSQDRSIMDDWMTKVRQALPGTFPAQEYVDRTSAAACLVGFHRGESLRWWQAARRGVGCCAAH